MGSPKNKLQQNFANINNALGQPADNIERISYGVISEVEFNSSQVKVKLLKDDKTIGEELSPGFLPLINSLESIFLNYGALRPGLLVRIYWRGKIRPQTAIIEVIGDENSSFLEKEVETNEITTGPFWIFSGGTFV